MGGRRDRRVGNLRDERPRGAAHQLAAGTVPQLA